MRKFLVTVGVALIVLLSLSGDNLAAQGNSDSYVLIFQTTEYNSRLGEAVDYFFNSVLKPEDNLALFSPQQPYNYSQKTRQNVPLKKLIERTKSVLKRDISVGAANHNSILENMAQLMNNIQSDLNDTGSTGGGFGGGITSTADLKKIMIQYRQLLTNLSSLRKLNEKLFLGFSKMFQQYQGQKNIVIFYEKEYRITPDRDTMNILRENSDLRFEVSELFVEENKDQLMDAQKIGEALKASGAKLHFIYLNKQVKRRQYMQYNEFSGDVYNTFSKIAEITGGTVTTTTKSSAALKKIFGEK